MWSETSNIINSLNITQNKIQNVKGDENTLHKPLEIQCNSSCM
jgi:hypothetical protein